MGELGICPEVKHGHQEIANDVEIYDAINLFVSLQIYALYERKLTLSFILVFFRSAHSQIAV
jgi:hypothetical protein